MTEIKIFSDGTAEGTRVVNMETNEVIACSDIHWLINMKTGKASAQIVLEDVEVVVVGETELDIRTFKASGSWVKSKESGPGGYVIEARGDGGLTITGGGGGGGRDGNSVHGRGGGGESGRFIISDDIDD